MNLYRSLERSACLWPGAGALATGTRVSADYAQLAHRAACLSAGLTGRLGLRPGECVALVATNCSAYIEALYACWHAGLTAVPVNAKLHPKELAYIFGNSGAKLALVSEDLAANVSGIPAIAFGSADYEALFDAAPGAPAGDEHPAWLFYTSGTTGQPKGATLTHANLLAMSFAYLADIDALAPGDSILHAAPLSHGSGLYALAHVMSGSLNVIPESGGFDANEMYGLIAAHQRVSFFAAPTVVSRMLNAPRAGSADLRHLKTLIYGGGPMYQADVQRAVALFGPRLFNLYGQGEAPMTITGLTQAAHGDMRHPRYLERLVSCGVVRSGCEVRIVDEDDRDVPAGEVGEIIARSACVMQGYWKNPEASARTLKGGWLHTGDLGTLDDDGFLTLRDRSKDLIISGGTNIYPREVEEVLLRDARVAECSVVGRAHADWGEEVVAFVVAHAGAQPGTEELDALCLAHIARFKRPKDYVFVDALPKNNYGKVLKTELRKRLESGVRQPDRG